MCLKLMTVSFLFLVTVSCFSRSNNENTPVLESAYRFEAIDLKSGRDDSKVETLGKLRYIGEGALEMSGVFIVMALQGDSARQIYFKAANSLSAGSEIELLEPAMNFIPKSWQGKSVNVSVSKLAPGSNVSTLLWYVAVTLK